MKYVIIGNSAAAVGCITGIRKKDPSGEIISITYEKFGCYSKPMIADVLIGYPDDKLLYRKRDFFSKNGVNLIEGEKVININREKRFVELESGGKIDYDKLLISTGATPFVPPIKGSDKEGVFTFTELSKAKELKKFIIDEKPQSAIVIGSGFIGLEVAYYLKKLNIDVTVVELLERPLGKALDERGSRIVQKIFEEKGIEFLFRNTVEEIIGENKVEAVRLKSGETLNTQVVVVAIGVRPNIELAQKAGLKVNRGIDTDLSMRTSDSDIYAAGDCVENIDITDGEKRNLPLFPLAFEQGFVAGINMAGGNIKYLGGIPLNSLKFLEHPVLNAGIVEPPDSSFEVMVNDQFERRGFYRKAIIKDNRLVGFVAIGKIERVGILTGIIRQKLDISSFKNRLTDIDFGIADLPESWRKERILNDKTAYKDWGKQ